MIRLFDPIRENAIPLADLHKRCFADPWYAEAIARLAGGSGFAFIAGKLADLDGFALARVAGDEAEILTVAVDPGRRRSGTGRALIQEAGKLAAARGAISMFLEVDTSNQAAIALYEGLGFRKAGERKGYYRMPNQPPTDAFVFRADLPLGRGPD